ncbi:MAG: hypothetical protein KAS39_07460, partial [Actinomycetia bacterium]|nr:hypothetical protein [Actinomycetes bacterium]
MNDTILEKMDISSSVIDILLQRISQLDKRDISILSYAAIIGKKFNIELLFELSDIKRKDIVQIVDRAIELQLLEEDFHEKGTILFVHDRIKEAFYKNIDTKAQRIIHLKIAQTIEKFNKHRIYDYIFELAHHYIEGGNKDKAIEYAIPAGFIAKAVHANTEALKYFKTAANFLEDNGKKGSIDWINSSKESGNICIITGQYDKAISIFNSILEYIKEDIVKATIYKSICSIYFKKGNYKKCEIYGQKGLKLLGDKLPITKLSVILSIGKEFYIHLLHNILPWIFKKKNYNRKSEKYRLIVEFYSVLNWLYILSDITKFIRSVLRMLNTAERKIGKSVELGQGLSAYGGLCMAVPLFKRSLKYHHKALEMRKEIRDEWGIAQSYQFIGFYYQWKGEIEKSIENFNESLKRFLRIGDLWEISMIRNGLGEDNFYISNYKEALFHNQKWLEMSRILGDDSGLSISTGNLLWIYSETGNFVLAEEFSIEGLKLSKSRGLIWEYCLHNIYAGCLNINTGNFKRAISFLEKAKELDLKNNYIQNYTTPLYPYLSEAYIADFQSIKNDLSDKEYRNYLRKINFTTHLGLKKTKPWV